MAIGAIDEDFANLNARADATSLFTKIMDYSLDKSLPAFKVGNQAISDSVANNLIKQKVFGKLIGIKNYQT